MERAICRRDCFTLSPVEISTRSETVNARRANQPSKINYPLLLRGYDTAQMHVSESAYELKARRINLRRFEALLVHRYADTLPAGSIKRLRTRAGYTDAYLPEEKDLIEAKRGSDIHFVREALAQLLDYSTHTNVPIDRLSALFPSRPSDRGVHLLNRFGIDCVYYADENHTFERIAASADAFQAVRAL